MLFVSEFILPNVDLISDSLAGYNYIQAGHVKWGASIISQMFGPLLLISLYVSCKNLNKWCRGGCQSKTETNGVKKLKMFQKEWWGEKKWTTLKICAQVPVFMPFIHLYFLYSLSHLEKTMTEYKDIYKKVSEAYDSGSKKSDEEKERDKQEVEKAADDFVEANTEHNKIMCIFQQIRLFEILGESGPQAATQIAIALRVGYIGPFQIASILISLASLAIGATKTLLLYPTAETKKQQQNKKPVCPKHILPLFIPAMLFCCAPRLLCLGIELAYLKTWSLVFLPVLVIISWIINVYYGKNNPLQTLSGVMTNLFAPCILMKDRSNFLKSSNIATIILQCLSILGIITLIGLETWIVPTPDNPPIIHCFNMTNKTTYWPTDSWRIERCKSTDCFSLTDQINEDGFVTLCNGMPAWFPLGFLGGVLIIWLLLSIPFTFLLHYLSDPVGLLVASKKTLFHCCQKYRPQTWDRDYNKYAVPVLCIMTATKDDIDERIKNKKGLDLPLNTLISKQLINEEDETWWKENKSMGKFKEKCSSAWENKGQILDSVKKCLCLPVENCIRSQDPEVESGTDSITVDPASRPVLITEDTIQDPAQDVKKITVRDIIEFAYMINSRVLLEQLKSLLKQHFEKELARIRTEHHETVDLTKQGEPVHILQVNCDDKTPEKNLKFCEMMKLTGAAETWRSIIQIKQRGK